MNLVSAHLPAPFIVGVGRSGTTLLRLMLDAHPDLAIPPETHFLHRLHIGEQTNADAFLEILTSAHTWSDFHLEKQLLAEQLALLAPFNLAEAIRVFFRQYANREGKARWGDKTPYYAECMPHIHGLLPEARFIHLIRDGRDVALSYRDKWFGPGKNLRDAARFWRDRIEHARQQAQSLPDGAYLEIRYEDLVRAPEASLRQIGEPLQLEFHPAMLDYHQGASRRLSEIQDHRDSSGLITVPRDQHLAIHQNTLRPPDPALLEKWQRELTPEENALFTQEAGDLLQQLGYPT